MLSLLTDMGGTGNHVLPLADISFVGAEDDISDEERARRHLAQTSMDIFSRLHFRVYF